MFLREGQALGKVQADPLHLLYWYESTNTDAYPNDRASNLAETMMMNKKEREGLCVDTRVRYVQSEMQPKRAPLLSFN